MKIYLFRAPKVYFIFQHLTMFSFRFTTGLLHIRPLIFVYHLRRHPSVFIAKY